MRKFPCDIDPSLITPEFLTGLNNLQCSKQHILFAISATLISFTITGIKEEALLNTVRTEECQVPIPENTFCLEYLSTILTWSSITFFFRQVCNNLQIINEAPINKTTRINKCLIENEVLNFILIIIVSLRRAKALTIRHELFNESILTEITPEEEIADTLPLE